MPSLLSGSQKIKKTGQMRMQNTKRRRALGSYYTPEWLARWMVARALSTVDLATQIDSWRILDPACGEGAFVLPLLDELAARRGVSVADIAGRLAIVRDRVFGVDADSIAIEKLHQRLAEWIGGGPCDTAAVLSILTKQFRCGDSLLGDVWSTRPVKPPIEVRVAPSIESPIEVPSTPHSVLSTQYQATATATESAAPLDWTTTFPTVATAGGFDLIIGNPPYRRELNAKSDFDRVAASSIGKQWRTARMDLWHYFFHRGLDLLKPGGRLAFIVNSYWTSAASAKRLRERMATESTLEEVVHFGSVPLFPQVSGRHLIFRVRKEPAAITTCRVFDLSNQSRGQIEVAMQRDLWANESVRIVPQDALWSNGQLRTSPESPRQHQYSASVLADQFDVRQGMAENPPFVTRAAALELGAHVTMGQGVFVLTTDEIAGLDLSDEEASLLRPYYALSTVDRFHVDSQPSHQVLYLTKKTAPSLQSYPRIAAHLDRYRVVLERRREVQSGQMAWWHLHWPREERLFVEPRVLCLQMGHEPRFAYAEQPTYVGFSMNVIVANGNNTEGHLSVAALTAVLNSSRAKHWFEANAKPRGAHLDISGTVLKQFPLPITSRPEILVELDRLARHWSVDVEERTVAESRLNQMVEQLYSA
ncbi:MAG TPA: Eco57I restriction-modification methylase domain-containing protein [Schlesneria sp.]